MNTEDGLDGHTLSSKGPKHKSVTRKKITFDEKQLNDNDQVHESEIIKTVSSKFVKNALFDSLKVATKEILHDEFKSSSKSNSTTNLHSLLSSQAKIVDTEEKDSVSGSSHFNRK